MEVQENGDDIRTVISENEGDLTEFVPKQMYQHVRQRVEELAKKVISEEKARMEARDEDSISPGASTPPKPWPDEAFEKEYCIQRLKQARGEKWVEEHRVMLDAQWEDLKSLLMGKLAPGSNTAKIQRQLDGASACVKTFSRRTPSSVGRQRRTT